LEIAQLEAFVYAADLGSFSKAAEQLSVAQPSLSNRIQALEREVGQLMFERLGRGVKLTDAGRVFLPYARKVLGTLDEGRHVLDGTRRGTAGQLLIATAPAVGTYVLPKILSAFHSRHPGIEIMARTGHSDDVARLIVEDEAQVGFGRPVHHRDIVTQVLYDEELVLVVPGGHPYAKRGTVTVEALTQEALILFDRDSSYYSMIMGLFRERGIIPHQQMQLDIALLPAVAVEREIKLGTLRKIQVETSRAVVQEIAIMYRRNKPQSGPMTSFLSLIEEAYAVILPRWEG
jgi:DNA-binding transcriptional LysR family regulator